MATMDTGYLTTQVSTIVGQLQGLFDEIGVPSHERDSRESEAGAWLSSLVREADSLPAVHCVVRNSPQSLAFGCHVSVALNALYNDYTPPNVSKHSEKNEMTEEAHRIIKNIKQMEASLDDTKAKDEFELEDEELKVTYPLIRCLQILKEKHNTIAKLHRERFEQVKSGYTSSPCTTTLLTSCRTCPGFGIILVPPRTLVHPNQSTPNLVKLLCPGNLRSFSFLCHSSRQ